MSLINRDNIEKTNFGHRGVPFKWNDFYRALVIKSRDPRKLGRVKVRIPDLMPEQDDKKYCGKWKEKGIWAHPANNYLGGRNTQDMTGKRAEFDQGQYQGSCLIPPEGSWVFIFFENGEPNHPYYFGSLDAGQTMVLPENQLGEEYEKKWTLIKTKQGRCIVLSDEDGDARIELTGKKRNLTNPPNGDTDSVLPIEDNQTVIRLWEKPGDERLELHDYRGNYILMHTNDEFPDQLHMYFHSDIHIESGRSIYIKSAEKMQLDVGTNYACTAVGSIDTKCGTRHAEECETFERTSVKDVRTAFGEMRDSTTGRLTLAAGSQMHLNTVGEMKISGKTNEVSGSANLILSGAESVSMGSEGPIVISGNPAGFGTGAPVVFQDSPWLFSGSAISAIPAQPTISIIVPLKVIDAPTPVVPEGDLEPPTPHEKPPEVKDPYDKTFGYTSHDSSPSQQKKSSKPPSNPPRQKTTASSVSTTQSTQTTVQIQPVTRIVGVGHNFALHLKDIYRDKIIPLVDKSYGTYTGFSLFKDPEPDQIDQQFFDTDVVPVYDNYRDPSSWTSFSQSTKWWQNLDSFCIQAAQYNITIIPTLFDFCCSPYDPFITKLGNPYTSLNWSDTVQGKYIQTVTQHIQSSGVNFILNLGSGFYNLNPVLPASGWLRKLIMFLLDQCSIPSDKLALIVGPDVNLYAQNPYCRYSMWTGSTAPQDEAINNEEFVDNSWGGTGRVEVRNDSGVLIDGYVKYILNCNSSGIACMNTWKMSEFISNIPTGMNLTNPNVMNYIFAPNQREAMRSVLKPSNVQNNGFIDFL